MCGIIGFSGTQFSKKDLYRGLKNIKHRGPDETISFKINEEDYFGMVRLAIRDTKNNLYPFKFKNLSLIYNGEIYNQDLIKNKLSKKINYKYKTFCDAEIILPLYDLYGPTVFKILQGMFAIAIYDNKKKQIIISRDIFGEKPLYYYYDKKSFFFASEVNAFPKKIKTISSNAIENYLALGFNPTPQTFFKNIYKVNPGQTVIFNTESKNISKFTFNNIDKILNKTTLTRLSNHQKILKLEKNLKRIFKRKIVSDVPIGVFLSGGLDSSLLAALIQQNSKTPLKTFSIKFEEQDINESHFSNLISKHLKTDHQEITFSTKDIEKNWDEIINEMDEPICDPALFPTFLLARYAKKYCPVILTGEGADEIFGGYQHYSKEFLAEKIFLLLRKIPSNNKISLLLPNLKTYRLFSKIQYHYTSVGYKTFWLLNIKMRKKYQELIQNSWENIPKKYPLNLKMQRYDLKHYVAEQLCMKVDKMTMKHSIESRAPFLDTKLLSFMKESANLASKNKPTKYLLKKVAQKYLPLEIVQREKQGFSLPLVKILNGPLNKQVNLLKNPHPLLKEIIPRKTINKITKDLKKGHKTYSLTLWNLITLDTWLKVNSK